MKIVYIAGKYSAKSDMERHRNIETARQEAEYIWAKGGAALCPHLNSAWMSGVAPEENFLKGDLLLLEKCDALLTCWNWEMSTGAKAEVEYAKKLGIPVFHNREDAADFLKV